MLHLTRHFILHLFKTKIFYFTLLFAFAVHFVTLKLIDSATVYINETQQIFGPDRVFLILFFIQLGVGSFVSMVYGVWIAPYLHQGERAPLTFSLPVSKWKFPIAYAITLLVLITLQNTMMFTLHGFIYGYEGYEAGTFPILSLVMCNAYEILVLLVGMFWFAVLAMFFGKVTSLFVGCLLFFLAQVAGMFFATGLGTELMENSTALKTSFWFYKALPPWDQALVKMSEQMKEPLFADPGLLPWVIWLVLLMGGFTLLLHFPRNSRSV